MVSMELKNQKTNRDAFNEAFAKISNKDLLHYFTVEEIQQILPSADICNQKEKSFCSKRCCSECYDEYFSKPYEKPYEEPKRWYLHRYSTAGKSEIFVVRTINDKKIAKSLDKNNKGFYTFEEACKLRTELNKQRENKKNLWLIGEE